MNKTNKSLYLGNYFLIILTMADTTPTKYNAPALDKGLDIIEFLSKEGIPMSQGEIAQGTQRTPNEIYRMLVCLEERAYIIRSADTGKYRLSLKIYSLSHRHSPLDELKSSAQVPMQALSQRTRQSCHLSVMYENRLMPILQIRGPGAVSLSIEEGTLFPLSLTSSGKVLLSMLPLKEMIRVLGQDTYYKDWSVEKQREVEGTIERVREQGYCHINSELTSGVTDIAVPIGLESSELVSVLAVSILTSNLEEGLDFQELLEAIQRAQQEINRLLGV